MSSSPSRVLESIGQVHRQLRVPHLGLADYRYLQRVGLRSYLRRTHTQVLIGVLVGMAIVLLPMLAVDYLDIRMGGRVVVGSGDHRLLIINRDHLGLAVLALVAFGAVATWICVVTRYRWLIRRIHEGSRRAMPYWSLDVGEDGLRMVWNQVSAAVPWSDVRDLHSNRTATFLVFDTYFKAIGISHAGFATDAEREAWLAFMKAKIPPATG